MQNTGSTNSKKRHRFARQHQRADSPDALVMASMDNPDFGKKLISTFRSLKPKEKPDE